MASIFFSRQYQGFKIKFRDDSGKTQQKALGKSPHTEADRQRAIVKASALGFTIGESQPVSTKPDPADFDTWLNTYIGRKKKILRPDGLAGFDTVMRQFREFIHRQGIVRLDAITAHNINEWVDAISPTLKTTTVINKLAIVSGIFTMALKEKQIKDHPVKYPLELAREADRAFWASVDKPEIKYLTPDQQTRLWQVLNDGVISGTVRAETRDIAVLMAYSGLRIKAAASLTFDDVDNDFINIPKTLDKGKKGYSAYLFPQAREVIERRRLLHTTGKLFPEILRPRYVWNHLLTILRREGLDDILAMGHFCHMFRHTHCVNLASNGLSAENARQQLGHSDIKTTMIYYQITRDTQRNALAAIKLD
jgi:integrase